MKVSLTRGSRENIKITTPLDLVLGEAILEREGKLNAESDTDTTCTAWQRAGS